MHSSWVRNIALKRGVPRNIKWSQSYLPLSLRVFFSLNLSRVFCSIGQRLNIDAKKFCFLYCLYGRSAHSLRYWDKRKKYIYNQNNQWLTKISVFNFNLLTECESVSMGTEFSTITVASKRTPTDCRVVIVDHLKMLEFGNFEMNFYIQYFTILQ